MSLKTPLHKKHPVVFFLLSVLLLNGLLFVPAYLVNLEITSFWPSSTLREGVLTGGFRKYLIRDNFDIFRISNDLMVLVGCLFLARRFPILRKGIFILAFLFYLVLFSYNIYYPISLKLYNLHPYIYNDLVLMNEVVPVFLAEFSPKVAKSSMLFFLGILVVFILLYFIMKWMFQAMEAIKWNKYWTIAAIGIVGFVFGSSYFYSDSKLPSEYQTSSWWTPKIFRSIYVKNSNAYASSSNQKKYRKAFQQQLTKKPNIYLLCIESYGRAVSDRDDLRDAYFETIDRLQVQLDTTKWHSASSFSTSTTSGGLSWLAFSSILSGTAIRNQIQYNDLIDNHYSYPNMTRYMKSQGYQTFRIKTFKKTNKSTNISYKRLDRWFAFDYWIKHHDFPYKGYKFDFLGGIPDQYSLGYFDEDLHTNKDQPLFLFVMTTNSHGPWLPPPPVVDDWRTLDTLKVKWGYKWKPYKDNLVQRYGKSINYQISFAVKFIAEHSDDNSLFIIIGDHQPATVVKYKQDDYDTPIHVVSKDSALVQSFKEYGFTDGLRLSPENSSIHHAGIYSILQRELTKNYGEDGAEIPPYLPKGLE